MEIHVLGSSAGGGFPQWNCGCKNCSGLRDGTIKAKARTQSSIAVSQNKLDWVLINASPDILTQLQSNASLYPEKDKRESKIKSIILIDSQIDHVTGLLMLREGCPHNIFCTRDVHEELQHSFPVFKILSHWRGGLIYNEINLNEDFEISTNNGIIFHAFPLVSNAPPYSKHRDNPRRGDNIGLLFTNKESGRSVFYAPGLGKVTDSVNYAFQKADVLLIDGTFWDENEMKSFGENERTATEMGHLHLYGKDGMLEVLGRFPNKRKILIHINNTNPILVEDSEERNILAKANVEVAFDGMIIYI